MKKLLTILFIFGFLFTVASCATEETPSFTTYTVTFNSMGGSDVESQEIIEGNPVRRPENPARDNFSFQGWYKTQETVSSNIWNFDIDRVNEDITLYAGWSLLDDLEPTASLTYELVDGTYTVTGAGDEEDIIIPTIYQDVEVTAIGESAFVNKNIKSVILPDTISSIGLNAFYNCANLESIYIGQNSSLESIANNAFSGNSVLPSIYLPASMTTLGSDVFNNCGSMEHFVVSSENPVFASMNGHLVQKETMTIIRGANQNSIPEGILEIGTAAFRRSTIDKLEIPASVTTIGNYAFRDCDSLESFEVSADSASFSSLDGILYNKNQTELIFTPYALSGDIELSTSLTAIPYAAFDARSSITSLFIPKGAITEIDNLAFRNTTLKLLFEGTEEEWNEISKKVLWGGSGLEIEYNASRIEETSSKILVTYFSWGGTTRRVAENIATKTNADLVEIVPQTPYTTVYNDALTVARSELSADARPVISNTTYEQIDIDSYDYIFIGYPIWYGYEPMIIRSFVEHYNGLAGKTVYLFDTSSSSSGNGANNSIKGLCPNADIPSFLHLNSSGVSNMDSNVTNWLSEIALPTTTNRIKMTIGTEEIYATLGNTASALDLVSRLQQSPITLSFEDYSGVEKIAYPEPALNVAESGYDPVIGDITIYVPWGNIAIFYVDSSGYSNSLVHVGTIEGNGISILAAQNNDFIAVVSLA